MLQQLIELHLNVQGLKTTKLPICLTPTDLLFYNLPASVEETHARRNLAFYILV